MMSKNVSPAGAWVIIANFSLGPAAALTAPAAPLLCSSCLPPLLLQAVPANASVAAIASMEILRAVADMVASIGVKLRWGNEGGPGGGRRTRRRATGW